jgi:hypothetical protein
LGASSACCARLSYNHDSALASSSRTCAMGKGGERERRRGGKAGA